MAMLSKSKVMAYLQCPKRLWLEVHRPDLRTDSSATAASFAAGHKVGDVSRAIYDPQNTGIFLDIKSLGLKGLIAATLPALAQRKVVFEAGFQADGTLSLADILIPVDDEDGPAWRMVEVKSSTAVKEYHVKDLAVQTAIATKAGARLTQVAVAHVDNTWVYPGAKQYVGLLKEVDQTANVQALQPEVSQWLTDAHAVANLPTQPERSTGDHCTEPYECGFLAHCASSEDQTAHPVSWIPRMQAKALKEHLATHAVRAMEDVPDELLNEQQLRVKTHTLSGGTYFDADGAKADLAQYGLPAYFLDFETINFAVPVWAGTRPFEQIPFQFSCHVMDKQQALTHLEFLRTDGTNPIRPFAEALTLACGNEGPIYVYNKGFEGARIDDLAKHVGDDAPLSAALLRIKDRLVDLMPIAKARFYHPSQEGSWSIKKVLPAMFPTDPEMDYKNLVGVQDGGAAQSAYLRASGLAEEVLCGNEQEAIRAQLLAYCKLDTFAMVRIWEKLTDRKVAIGSNRWQIGAACT